MKRDKSMLWAEFRLAVIGRLLFSHVHDGELSTELDKLSRRTWLDPEDRAPIRIGRSTIERWYYKALANPSDPLCSWMNDRSDKGSFPSVSRRASKILDRQHERHPEWKIGQHFHVLRNKLQRSRVESLPHYASVRRYVRHRSDTDGCVNTLTRARVDRLAGLISHLRRVIIVKCILIRLLESGCTRRPIYPKKIAWSRLGSSEKQYVLHALKRYRRAGGSFLQFCKATNLSTASIERWLSAHFYHVAATRANREEAGSVAETKRSKVDLGLNLTHYGQHAMLLDVAGGLATLDEMGIRLGLATVTWLGTPDEEED